MKNATSRLKDFIAMRLAIYSADRQSAAVIFQNLQEEIEDAEAEAAQEVGTISQAADICGYSSRRLRQMVEEGTLDAVSEGPLRVRIRDLPFRPGHSFAYYVKGRVLGAEEEQTEQVPKTNGRRPRLPARKADPRSLPPRDRATHHPDLGW